MLVFVSVPAFQLRRIGCCSFRALVDMRRQRVLLSAAWHASAADRGLGLVLEDSQVGARHDQIQLGCLSCGGIAVGSRPRVNQRDACMVMLFSSKVADQRTMIVLQGRGGNND